MNKRWRITTEITFDIKQEEDKHKALDRVKSILDKMLDKEQEINHYHILEKPHIYYELD